MNTPVKIKKKRADILLLENELCHDIEEARKLILAGKLRIGSDCLIHNPSEILPEDSILNLETDFPYVSRGALKLKAALEKYLPDLNGLQAMDVGASTGGFTDLMLQNGAEKVFTIDSGRGQLHLKLREDRRVICYEQTNARTLPDNFLPFLIDIITMDVSFISVIALLPSVNRFLKPGGMAFILIKPQFEAERREVERGGVVRDTTVIERCIEKVSSFCRDELHWEKLDVIASPIKGPKGNQEYMSVFRK